jgi:AcrR family transcriptional regulator
MSYKNRGRVRQKHRTQRLLLDTAARLMADGTRPTVSQVADAAEVSRRTAYRYFPTQERLIADAALEQLRPAMEAAIAASAPASADDAETRISTVVEHIQRLALEYEPFLRTMIHETVLAPPAHGNPRRGIRRLQWIESAVKPLRTRLGAARYRRLVSALALCTGIEALLVLRDICGLSAGELTRVSQWMCLTLVRESLRERQSSDGQ